jgi:hypothetical protein
MRHKVEAGMPTGDVAIKMWNGDVKPLLACGRTLKQVVNFYQAEALPGGYACSKCFPPDPTLPKGATVVIQLAGTQVILTGRGFYARCQRCPWTSGETVSARYTARSAAEGHERSCAS